jgi:hypothetical protein
MTQYVDVGLSMNDVERISTALIVMISPISSPFVSFVSQHFWFGALVYTSALSTH